MSRSLIENNHSTLNNSNSGIYIIRKKKKWQFSWPTSNEPFDVNMEIEVT